jgi:hypothetical protein
MTESQKRHAQLELAALNRRYEAVWRKPHFNQNEANALYKKIQRRTAKEKA